jgi:hypothetical protein
MTQPQPHQRKLQAVPDSTTQAVRLVLREIPTRDLHTLLEPENLEPLIWQELADRM